MVITTPMELFRVGSLAGYSIIPWVRGKELKKNCWFSVTSCRTAEYVLSIEDHWNKFAARSSMLGWVSSRWYWMLIVSRSIGNTVSRQQERRDVVSFKVQRIHKLRFGRRDRPMWHIPPRTYNGFTYIVVCLGETSDLPYLDVCFWCLKALKIWLRLSDSGDHWHSAY